MIRFDDISYFTYVTILNLKGKSRSLIIYQIISLLGSYDTDWKDFIKGLINEDPMGVLGEIPAVMGFNIYVISVLLLVLAKLPSS